MSTEQKIKEAFDAKYGDVSCFNCLEDYQDLLSTFRAGYLALLNSPELEQCRKDAERYRWLRDTLTSAVGGGVRVNDAALVYEESEPCGAVQVYWYPDTPVGFYESKADSLDEAIDAAIRKLGEK